MERPVSNDLMVAMRCEQGRKHHRRYGKADTVEVRSKQSGTSQGAFVHTCISPVRWDVRRAVFGSSKRHHREVKPVHSRGKEISIDSRLHLAWFKSQERSIRAVVTTEVSGDEEQVVKGLGLCVTATVQANT